MLVPSGNWRPDPNWRANIAAAWRAIRARAARLGIAATLLGRRRDDIERESGDW